MMPGYGNTGDSVYGHHLDFLNERVQETIDFISRYLMGLGQDGEVITSTDIEGLFYCAAFADSLEGTDPEDPKGFVAQMNMLDGNMPGLRDRTVFETARGRVSGALPHKAIEERKPRSQQADVLAEERKMKMESNREEWIKMNPELTKKILDIKDQEDRFNKMESTIQSIPEIVRVIVKEELNKREPRPSATGEPSKSTAGTGQEVSVLPPLYLEYHVDTRYWKVDTDRKTGYPDISTSIVYPAETPAELSLSILLSDGESKAQVSSVE